jgi:hypothetical protein
VNTKKVLLTRQKAQLRTLLVSSLVTKKLQSEGKLDKAKGSARNLAGDVKGAARDASRTAED